MSGRPAPRRAPRSDHRVIRALVGRHDAGLRALAYRVLDDHDAMTRALQAAYAAAHRSHVPAQGPAMDIWIHRIAYRACLDELRRRPARRRTAGDSPGLEGALAGLPVDERTAVLLVDALGFDQAAAAEIMGVAHSVVAARLAPARARLRHALSASEEAR